MLKGCELEALGVEALEAWEMEAFKAEDFPFQTLDVEEVFLKDNNPKSSLDVSEIMMTSTSFPLELVSGKIAKTGRHQSSAITSILLCKH